MDVVKNKLKKVAKHIDKYKMTLKIFLFCFIIQTICSIFPSLTYYLAFNLSSPLSIFQLISYQFSHAGWDHFLGNMGFGLPFMVYVEHKIGSDNMLKSYLACGIAALVMHIVMTGSANSLIGSSGSIFGLFSLACYIYGETPLEKILAYLFFLTLFIPQFIMASYSLMMPTGIAYFGHVGGALAALLLPRFLKIKK